LLYSIQDGVLGDTFVPIYIDVQGLSTGTIRDLFRTVFNVTKTTIASRHDRSGPSHFEVPPEMPEAPSFADMSNVLLWGAQQIAPRSLLVMFDEYEQLQHWFRDPQLARQAQHFFEHQQNICTIFAGSRKVEALSEKNFLFLVEISKYVNI